MSLWVPKGGVGMAIGWSVEGLGPCDDVDNRWCVRQMDIIA